MLCSGLLLYSSCKNRVCYSYNTCFCWSIFRNSSVYSCIGLESGALEMECYFSWIYWCFDDYAPWFWRLLDLLPFSCRGSLGICSVQHISKVVSFFNRFGRDSTSYSNLYVYFLSYYNANFYRSSSYSEFN